MAATIVVQTLVIVVVIVAIAVGNDISNVGGHVGVIVAWRGCGSLGAHGGGQPVKGRCYGG